jgi:hypothetical protein
MDLAEAAQEPFGGSKHLVARNGQTQDPLEHRPTESADPSTDRRDALDPPATGLRQ